MARAPLGFIGVGATWLGFIAMSVHVVMRTIAGLATVPVISIKFLCCQVTFSIFGTSRGGRQNPTREATIVLSLHDNGHCRLQS